MADKNYIAFLVPNSLPLSQTLALSDVVKEALTIACIQGSNYNAIHSFTSSSVMLVIGTKSYFNPFEDLLSALANQKEEV